MGAPLGNVEGGLFTRALHVEEGSGDGHLSPQWPWGTWEGGVGCPFTGTLRYR